MVWIRHANGEPTVIKNQQALGPESPLETDERGYAEVDDADAADLLATLDSNVEVVTQRPADDGDEQKSEEFDAAAFVDRTPMSDVIADIESGDYNKHLDAIEAAAGRKGVQDAIDAAREE